MKGRTMGLDKIQKAAPARKRKRHPDLEKVAHLIKIRLATYRKAKRELEEIADMFAELFGSKNKNEVFELLAEFGR